MCELFSLVAFEKVSSKIRNPNWFNSIEFPCHSKNSKPNWMSKIIVKWVWGRYIIYCRTTRHNSVKNHFFQIYRDRNWVLSINKIRGIFDGCTSRNISDRAKLASFRMLHCTKSTVFNMQCGLLKNSMLYQVKAGSSLKRWISFCFYSLAIETGS